MRAGIDAYHNFLFDEFCAADPNRLFGVGQIPSLGVDTAIEYLGKLKARGAKAIVISNWPAGGDGIEPQDDRFWAACVEEEMPVCVHIQIDSRAARQAAWAAQAKAASVGGVNLGGTEAAAGARAKAVGNLGAVFIQVAKTINQFVFTGVFERFPQLQLALIETGVGWIPHLLEQLDDRYWRNRSRGGDPYLRTPFLLLAPKHHWDDHHGPKRDRSA